MTWVIGRAGPFGHAIGLSDIRVTIPQPDGSYIERDCLQKVYLITPGVALGFAGSVKIGFEIVTQLSIALQADANIRWDPIGIAENLPMGTRVLFNTFDPKTRAGGCELILLGAHPKENDGPAPWAKCYVYRFRAPDFEPILAGPAEIVSIGSGDKIGQYTNVLASLEKDFEMFKLEVGMRGGSALGLMMQVTSTIKKMPRKGISAHLQVFIVGRDGTKVGSNDITGQKSQEDNFIMPPIAHSWEELQKILSSSGISESVAQQAIC